MTLCPTIRIYNSRAVQLVSTIVIYITVFLQILWSKKFGPLHGIKEEPFNQV